MSLVADLGRSAPQSKFNLHHDAIVKFLDREESWGGKLYPAQVQALKCLDSHFKDERKANIALIVLPTGAGKSGVAVLAPFVLNSTRVLILTPSVIISKQLYKDMCECSEKNFFAQKGLVPADESHKLTERGYHVTSSLGDMATTLHEFNTHYLVIANAHKFGANSAFNMELLPQTMFDTVIVDEAHHYPAATWKRIVDHFPRSKRVFLTATPYHNGSNILGNDMDDQRNRFLAYQLTREDAVNSGLIRKLRFFNASDCGEDVGALCTRLEVTVETLREEIARVVAVAKKLSETLDDHDNNSEVKHQAMILCQLVDEVDRVVEVLKAMYGDKNAVGYHGGSGREGFERFCSTGPGVEYPRFLVVCGKATEGFDRRQVSAVGILRNVCSSVLFSQFVGRCVRRMGPEDDCIATIVSHPKHSQEKNFEKLDKLAESDPVAEDDAI